MELCIIRNKETKEFMCYHIVDSGCSTCGSWTDIEFDNISNILEDVNKRLCIYENMAFAKEAISHKSYLEVVKLTEVME